MKKIGVLTYLKEYANLGTNMQSYCTFKAVQKSYPNDLVELINYSSWKPAKRPYLSQMSLKSLTNDFIRIKKYNQFFRNNLVLSSDKMISSDHKKSIAFLKRQHYDAIYVGSDTILELKRARKDELTAYWLDNSVKAKKFLVAASSHNVVFESLSEKQKIEMQQTLDDFSLLGVRDEATKRLIKNFVSGDDERLKMVPDPTFTYEIDYTHVQRYIKKRKLNLDKPIVCLHLLRHTKWASTLASKFKKAGYLVASLRPAYYADILFTDLSPFEQVGLYKYFDLVVTHRFHDSIFCLKNSTPVIVYPEFITDVTLHGENKNLSLFKSFKLAESNYIGDSGKMNADDIFNMHVNAIRAFKESQSLIGWRLNKYRCDYEDFISMSKTFVD